MKKIKIAKFIVLLILSVFFVMNTKGQTTKTLYHTYSDIFGIFKRDGYYPSNTLKAGYDATEGVIFRGYIEFDLNQIPTGATITSAVLHLSAPTQKGGGSITSGTVSFRNLARRVTGFSGSDDWSILNGDQGGTNFKSITLNYPYPEINISDAALVTKIKNSIGSRYLYFGIINSAESSNGFYFGSVDLKVTYNIPIPPDPTPPSTPQNFAASSVTRTDFNLSWSASTDNVGVTGYIVYLNGALKTVTGTSTSYSGLIPNTEYIVQVKAKDAAGNLSGYTELHVITTPLVLPLFSDISTTTGIYNAFAYNQINLTSGFRYSALNATNQFVAKIITGSQITKTKSASIYVNSSNDQSIIDNENSNNENSSVSIYPNPVEDILYINGYFDANVDLFDLSGRKVLQLTRVNGSIDVSGLKAGTYIIKLKDEKNCSVKKIVIR
jgi:hypothetical protein